MQAVLRPQRSSGVAALRLHRGEPEQTRRSGARRRRELPIFDLPEFRDENESLTMIMALLTAGAFQ